MERIEDLIARSIDYWESVQYDDVPTEDDEDLALDWLECNGCPVVYDDGAYKVWEDVTDDNNLVISTPQGLRWARRLKEESNA